MLSFRFAALLVLILHFALASVSAKHECQVGKRLTDISAIRGNLEKWNKETAELIRLNVLTSHDGLATISAFILVNTTQNFISDVSKGRECTSGNEITDISVIRGSLEKWNRTLTKLANKVTNAEWNWAANITKENENKKTVENARYAAKVKELWQTASCYNCKTANCTAEEARRLQAYESIGTAALPSDQFKDYTYIQTTMESIYSTAEVCLQRETKNQTQQCLPLDPDLSNIFLESSDYCKLQWAWEGWRNETGRKIRGYFTSYVMLQNEAAKLNGFQNAKEMWTSAFTRDDQTYFDQLEAAWLQVKPLYQELHTYTRRKLMTQRYASYSEKFPQSGHIPAHLLGNMWAQDWTALYNLLTPYPNAPAIDITELLKQNKTRIYDMVRESDKFFQSIGLPPMTNDFWKKSIFVRPSNKTEMVCHASAWDFYTKTDFRIKMCTQVNQDDFQTIHHEMGHIAYFQAYKDQPIEFRDGANPGFHEAIGDLIALSVMTPGHLKAIGLLPTTFEEDNRTSMNSLMNMALQKVAFLPFGYLVDKYRWAVFERKVLFSDLNSEWWKLRCNLQGVSPPVERSEQDFDPGAKYHIPASVPYDRYFYAAIVQFQFHRALCQRMNITKDFHNCDIYRQKEAVAPLREVLALGASKPYPEALRILTGSSKLDASAILDYFAPLYDWLKEQNKGEAKTSWDENCPVTLPKSPCGDYSFVEL